jgi:Mlc titration factor MtfA (ptsG expression regulator)/Tfp pilus assembly protein PilF
MIFGFGKRDRRQRLAGKFPSVWLDYLRDGVLYYHLLTEAEQARLRDLTHVLVVEKNWEGCGGQQITDEVKVIIAAQAALLLLGLDEYYFDELATVLVYPGGFLSPGEEPQDEEQMRLGEALSGGPIALSWWHARWSGRRLSDLNVVLHEFAHKLAELGDSEAGRPPLLDRALWKRWDRVMTRERLRLAEDEEYGRPTLIDPYGAQDGNEFFAVATETFFARGRALQARHPEAYELLAAFYRQDPASRRLPPELAAQAREANEEYDRQAVSECTVALRLRPDYLEAYRQRAEHRLALDDVTGALEDHNAILARVNRREERAEALLARAQTFQAGERPGEALADLNEALRLCPDHEVALVERAALRTTNGDLDAALADLDEALRLCPRDDAAWRWRGEVYYRLDRHEQALHDLDRAVQLSPHDAEGYEVRADVLEALGRKDDAQRDRDTAEQLAEQE